MMLRKYQHFSESEFKRASPACSSDDMNERFMNMLETARTIADIPFVINSAYRSSAYDKSRGRTGTGMHTKGRAVDISCTTSVQRFRIISACLIAGFTGIGISNNFIHIDDREVDNPVIWLY